MAAALLRRRRPHPPAQRPQDGDPRHGRPAELWRGAQADGIHPLRGDGDHPASLRLLARRLARRLVAARLRYADAPWPRCRPHRALHPARRAPHRADGGCHDHRRSRPPPHRARLRQSEITVLENMGGPRERQSSFIAEALRPPRSHSDLNTLAIHCIASPGAKIFSRLAGLPDDAFMHDGQLTKREVRAATLAALGPLAGPAAVGRGCGLRLDLDRMDARRARARGHRLREQCRSASP